MMCEECPGCDVWNDAWPQVLAAEDEDEEDPWESTSDPWQPTTPFRPAPPSPVPWLYEIP